MYREIDSSIDWLLDWLINCTIDPLGELSRRRRDSLLGIRRRRQLGLSRAPLFDEWRILPANWRGAGRLVATYPLLQVGIIRWEKHVALSVCLAICLYYRGAFLTDDNCPRFAGRFLPRWCQISTFTTRSLAWTTPSWLPPNSICE